MEIFSKLKQLVVEKKIIKEMDQYALNKGFTKEMIDKERAKSEEKQVGTSIVVEEDKEV